MPLSLNLLFGAAVILVVPYNYEITQDIANHDQGPAYVIYQIVYNIFFSPLKRFPGPLLYAASSVPFDLDCLNGKAHVALTRLHDKYGPIVRSRPNELSYIDGRVWKEAYGFRSGHTEWFKGDGFAYLNGVPGILSAPKESHRRFRRSLAHAFSNQGLRDQSPRILEYANQLVACLSRHAKEGPVDMVKWFSWTTTDVIGDLAFGETFGCLKSEQEHNWMASTFRLLRPGIIFGILERWHLTPLAGILVPSDVFRGLRDNAKFISEKMKKRVSHEKERGDFFDRLLKHGLVVEDAREFKDTADGQEGFTLKELESTAQDFVFAGSETTASLLSATVYYLLRNPLVLDKLTHELRSAFAKEEEITISSTNPSDLPYLDAVLTETIRINDPVPLFAPRVAPKGGDTIDGVYIPEGTRVHCAKIVAHRSEYNFARPHEFVPERWYPIGKGRPAEFENDNPHGVFQPFGYGARNCIGMNLAKAEMHLIVAKLIWRFDLSRPRMSWKEENEWEHWVERQDVYFLWVKPPLMIDLKERQDLVI
jgi:averantin hydroxylase